MPRNDDAAVRKTLAESPHLFSARRNRDFETMASFANEQHGTKLTAKDVATMYADGMADGASPAQPKPRATARKR